MAPAAPSSALSLHDVVALSGRFPLLSGVDLEVDTGETLLVEGPNGAGKTSLLRVCAGLVPVASGRVTVLGLDPVRHRTSVRRRIGMLAHTAHLYDDLTVRENVRFAVRAARADPARVDPACERLGLTGRLLRTGAAKLSAGQRRRVALAVLVARAPELWLLDEPHAGLDASARALLGELLAEAVGGGATVVVASHEPELIEPLATRSVTVAGGRVVGERVLHGRPHGAATSPSDATEPDSGPVASPGEANLGAASRGAVAHVA